MFEIGRLCLKIAGRDANKKCIIVDKIDNNFVLIDGQTRRRKCNVAHLEPLDKIVKIKKKASNADVLKALKKLNIEIKEKKINKKKNKKEKETKKNKQSSKKKK